MENSNSNGIAEVPQVPVIDLDGVHGERRAEIVAEIRKAAENWGVFQMVNHGVPADVLDGMLDGLRRFHEQPVEAKKQFLADDFVDVARTSKLTLDFRFDDGVVKTEQFPPIISKEVEDYSKAVINLKETLSELLSEALGLSSNYFSHLECMETVSLRCHYYPPCPQQDNSSGLKIHSDSPFLTILLQDEIGGLQVLYEDNWVDVQPKKGTLIAHIADLMQLITNDTYKSVVHRVVMRAVDQPRLSAATQFLPSLKAMAKPLAPIKELLSNANPPIYKEVTFRGFIMKYLSKEVEGIGTLNLPSIRV